MQVPQFTAFQFRLNIMNNGQVIFSGIAVGIRDSEGIFECSFELSDQIRTITDSTEIEILVSLMNVIASECCVAAGV